MSSVVNSPINFGGITNITLSDDARYDIGQIYKTSTNPAPALKNLSTGAF